MNDTNRDLMETYKACKKGPLEVSAALAALKKGKRKYLQLRRLNPEALDQVQRAARFIYLNRYCFNGLYRTNADGQFNVPYSGVETGQIPTELHLAATSRKLRRSRLLSWDFEEVVDRHVARGDFVYLDPPYVVKHRRVFKEYSSQPFSDFDLERVLRTLHRINKVGAHFVLSHGFTAELWNDLSKWNRRKVLVSRNVAGFSRHRRTAFEIIASNMPLPSSTGVSS